MSWLWRRVTAQAQTQTQVPVQAAPEEMNLVTIESIVRQLDRYGIANASCPVGDIIGAYETDFVFSCKKKDSGAVMRVYTTALDFANACPESSVFLITHSNDAILESAASGGHPHNLKILLLVDC